MSGRDERTGSDWLRDEGAPAEATLRRAIDELAARPADEIALRRTWAQVGAELATPVRPRRASNRFAARWALGGVAIGLAGAAVTTLLLTSNGGLSGDQATIQTPPPAVAHAEAPAERPRAFLRAPAIVRTNLGERLKVTLKGGTQLELDPASVVNVDGADQPAVEAGRVVLQVPKQEPGRRFVVAAGPYRIVVVGTRFGVQINHHDVAVDVQEGAVEVWSGSRVVRVDAGQVWSGTRAPSKPARVDRARPTTTHATSRDVWQPALAAPMPVPSFGGAASAPLPPSFGEGPRLAPVESAPVRPVVAPAPVDPVREARAALAAGEPDRAAELLRRASRRAGATGENATYELGRVLRDQLLRPRDALEVWSEYRARHPHGLLRAEVDLSLLETFALLGDDDRARAAAQDFLAAYPRSERRREVEAVLARLGRSQPR